jgi:GDP/UDP-N,N'-diacetylbacillosamine 2-epimerase (hydrolysing)
MKIGILTSSRADYGIYIPLLEELKKDIFFNLHIIAFGTHLSKKHDYTIKNIIKDEYKIIHKINTFINDDSQKGIVDSYSKTISEFSKFWNKNRFDLVFCLGDRFEMSAAVQSSIPFGIMLAHVSGGETTLGAIDNIYRHQITVASKIHFVSTNFNLKKVVQITGNSNNVYNVGSLSLSNIKLFKPTDKSTFFNKFGIKNEPYILVTFHPETVSVEANILYAKEISKALSEICKEVNIIITMPNADTLGSVYRKEINNLKYNNPNSILLIENFGKKHYFNAMYYSLLLLGNTSSGIIEAASFGKYVINVGDRQKGRTQSLNVYNVNFDSKNIIKSVFKLILQNSYSGKNIYYKKHTAKKIVARLKNNFK